MRIDPRLQRLQLRLVRHLLDILHPRNLHQRGNNLREADGHCLQGISDFVGFGVINFERAGNLALLLQRNDDKRTDMLMIVIRVIVADRDFPA
ncbi:hypothetical protein D3C73_1325930 [compost metagenome]